ncbi:MAG: DUF3562 domain-containing protein [Steroidobacter sp.]
MASSTPRAFSGSKNHQTTKEAIAEETHTPVDEVAKIYDEELSALAADAKITQYLGVLASKRVRMKLREH